MSDDKYESKQNTKRTVVVAGLTAILTVAGLSLVSNCHEGKISSLASNIKEKVCYGFKHHRLSNQISPRPYPGHFPADIHFNKQ